MENINLVKNQNQLVFCKDSSIFAHIQKTYNLIKTRAKIIFSHFQVHHLAGYPQDSTKIIFLPPTLCF